MKNIDTFSPRLPALRGKRAELQVENARLKSECAIIRQRMLEAPYMGNDRDQRVAELLGKKPVAVESPAREKLLALQQEIEAFNAAIALLDSEILKETRLASNALLESVAPEVKRYGQAFAKAFADLHDAHLAYDSFLDEIEDSGANVGQLRLRPNGTGHPRDRSGAYFYGLQEFVAAGYFSKSNMPKVFA